MRSLLVVSGPSPQGKQELVSLTDGVRENIRSSNELLDPRSQTAWAVDGRPELAVANGALGFWQALEKVWAAQRSTDKRRAHPHFERPEGSGLHSSSVTMVTKMFQN
jgi:hypothetical protein